MHIEMDYSGYYVLHQDMLLVFLLVGKKVHNILLADFFLPNHAIY